MNRPWALLILVLCLLPQVQGQKFEVQVEVVARNLDVPWSLAFAPDERIFFTERPGRIRVIENNIVRTLLSIDVAAVGEAGLLGLALDPSFDKNQFLYTYYTYRDVQGALLNRIVRFTESSGTLVSQRIILDRIPGSGIHDGGRVKFGPDGKLYATTGDAAQSALSQDLNSLAGKVLRMNSDGSTPSDNPFSGSLVYTYGHRNPQGLDWHPLTGKIYATEHGPSGRDEVNILEAGKNYGWPTVTGAAGDPRFVDPLIETGTDTWAPSGATFYRRDRFPDLRNAFLIATLRGQHLRVLTLSSNFNSVTFSDGALQGTHGRLRDVVEGPDGFLYVFTSNRDGRGNPAPDDDRLLKILSAQIPEFRFEQALLPVVLVIVLISVRASSRRLRATVQNVERIVQLH